MFKLYFLIGISGSGKSTYIRSHFIPEVVVSPDELRKKLTGDVSDQSQNGKIWTMVPKLLLQTMEKYGKAVLDATNVDSGDRAKLLKSFNRNTVERIAVVFDTDPEEAKKRIHKDLESGKDRSDVPDDIIDRQYEKFKRGYKSIKQQFDKVIDGNKGRSEMKEELIRKIVSEEMKKFLQEDAVDATEEQNYKVYQDMYLTPQSNWKLKKYVPMLSAKGQTYSGKLGEIHKIQTVEYDLFHQGEVVTECGGETYSIDADDFRNGFEMVNDEEHQNVNNESIIKEEVKKLVKIKDYFGKNIKESIERLEKFYLNEAEKSSNFDAAKAFAERYKIKYSTETDRWNGLEKIYFYGTVKDFYKDMKRSKFIQITKPEGLRPDSTFTGGVEVSIPLDKSKKITSVVSYQIIDEYSGEPEDAYLDQDFEDRISGTEDYGDLYEKQLKEFEYEDSDGQMEDPEEDDYHQQTRWTPVHAKFYFADDFDESDLLILIFNDPNENVMVRYDTLNTPVLSFQLSNGNKLEMRVDKEEFERAVHDTVSMGFVEHDSEGKENYYYLTEKGLEYCSQNKYDSSERFKGVLSHIKEIRN